MKDFSKEVDSSAEAYYSKNIENLSHLTSSLSLPLVYAKNGLLIVESDPQSLLLWVASEVRHVAQDQCHQNYR